MTAVYLRNVGADEDECWLPCAKGDTCAVAFCSIPMTLVEALRSALEPFAEGANYYDEANLSPGEYPWRDDHPANPVFKVGQLREARRVLALSSQNQTTEAT